MVKRPKDIVDSALAHPGDEVIIENSEYRNEAEKVISTRLSEGWSLIAFSYGGKPNTGGTDYPIYMVFRR